MPTCSNSAIAPLHNSSPSCTRRNVSRLIDPLKCCLAIVLMLASVAAMAQTGAGAGAVGKWQILTNPLPLNPVHAAVMHNGKVLMVDGRSTTMPLGAVWDPATQVATAFTVPYTMFCNGMVVLPDGRPFVMGGTLQFKPVFTGQPLTSAYSLSAGSFTN